MRADYHGVYMEIIPH